jgi:glycosyltransferase involved in cell wall biosynthesis
MKPKQRTLALVKALDQAFSVTVLALLTEGCNPAAFREELSGRLRVVDPTSGLLWRLAAEPRSLALGMPLRYARYVSPPVRAALAELLREEKFDIVHFDHPHMGQLLPMVRRAQPDVRLVLDEHNVEAHLLQSYAALLKWPQAVLLRRQAARVMALERRLVRQADATLACSDENAADLGRLGARHVAVIPNGVTIDPRARGPWKDRNGLVFIGSLDWRPNVDAAMRLATRIWPRVRDAIPGSYLAIVGRRPPPRLRECASERVLVTGRVDSVAPYLRSARATAVPLRAGSGTRIKIIEAWAAGVPVIANRLAAEGLAYSNGQNMLIADTDEGFADAIARVWHDPDLASRLASRGEQTAVRYDPAKIGQRLVSFYAAGLWPAEEESEESARAYTIPAYRSATARPE